MQKYFGKIQIENKIPAEDISTLIELSLNLCEYSRQFYNLKSTKQRSTYISFHKLEDPLTREIKCFGIPLKKNYTKLGTRDYLIEIYFYKKLSPTKFELHYNMTSNSTIIIESTIEFINNTGVSTNCSVSEI